MMGYSRLFTCMLSSIFIVDMIKKQTSKFSDVTVLNWIWRITLFESIIVLLAYVNSDMHKLLSELCGGSSRYANKLEVLSGFRGIGWTFAQYSDFAVCLGSGLLCYVCTIAIRHTKTTITQLKQLIFLLIFISSGILVGRTFQIYILLSIFFYFYCTYKNDGFNKTAIVFFQFAAISVIIIISIISLLNDYISEETINWAFEIFNSLENNDSLRTDSTDELKSMWRFPKSIISIIFGEGQFVGNGSHPTYSESDVGFINSIYYWGIIGSILYYYTICKSFMYSVKTTNVIYIKYLSLTILAGILIYNLKGLGNGFAYSCLILQGNIITKQQQLN